MEADQVHASLRVYVSVERTTDVGERKQVVTDPCHGYSILPVPNDVQYCTNARTARTLLWNYMRGSLLRISGTICAVLISPAAEQLS